MKQYSLYLGLEKTALRVIIIALPILAEILPEQWMNLTLGGVITFLINFAKNYHPPKNTPTGQVSNKINKKFDEIWKPEQVAAKKTKRKTT